MAKEVKNENATINEEQMEKNIPETPEAPAEEKKEGKVKAFFKKHSGKIKTGLFVAGGIAAGVVADKIGVKLGGKKKADEPTSEPEQ